jgi:hypothetical protein
MHYSEISFLIKIQNSFHEFLKKLTKKFRKMQNKNLFLLIFSIIFINKSIFATLNTVILKKGDVIVGQVVGQNSDRIQVKSDSGKVLEIPKKNILKVLYKEITKKEEEAILKKEEEKIKEKYKKEEEKKLLIAKMKEDELSRFRKERLQSYNEDKAYPKEKLKFLSSYKVYKSYHSGILTIASPDSICTPFANSSDWYILFGAIALTSPDMGKLLPSDSQSIQLRYETSLLDIGATLLGAILITMTRKTLYVDVCEDKDQPKYITLEEVKLEKDIDRKLIEDELKEKEKQELEENIRLEVELRKLERIRGKL